MNKQALIEECVSKLNPIDDLMFRKMAEEKDFCEEILRTILEDPNLEVLENKAQWSGTNMQGRSIIVDAKCLLGDGRHINVEVQKSDNDDHQRRVRYHGAILTTNISDTGTDFRQVPDVCVIYISTFGIFYQEDPDRPILCFHIDRVVRETGEIVTNGFEEIYINANARDGSELSKLMTIFMEDRAYDRKKFPATSECKKRYKESVRGERSMSDDVNKIIRQLCEIEIAERLEQHKAELEEIQAEIQAERQQHEAERQQHEAERQQHEAERQQHQKEVDELKTKLQEALSKNAAMTRLQAQLNQ